MMRIRVVSALFLFVAAVAAFGVLLGLTVFVASRAGFDLEWWFPPLLALPCFVAIFFLGREHVLPREHLAPARAIAVLTAALGATMALALLLALALRPVAQLVGVGPSAFTLWFALVLVLATVVDRRTAMPKP